MLNIYLSGEIHTDWREEIINLCKNENLNISFSSPITNHEASDNCGVEILGQEEKNFWKDTIRFSQYYYQWLIIHLYKYFF